VWDGSLLHVFLDGTDFASRKLDRPSDALIPPIFRSCIGGFDDAELIRRGYKFFQGRINQVRISRTARYQNPFTPQTRFEPDNDTLALYHFDEGQGDVLTDSSGNNHHGKIVGAKWVAGISPRTAEASPAPEPRELVFAEMYDDPAHDSAGSGPEREVGQ